MPARDTASADRVPERRRPAALARHYRDAEQLPIAEIARRLGHAPATIEDLPLRPRRRKARAVKAHYRGYCRTCGADTSPRNGKGHVPVLPAAATRAQAERRWTRE